MVASTTALSVAAAVPGSSAYAADGVTVVATGFAGPLHVDVAPGGDVLVADAFAGVLNKVDPDTGKVTALLSEQGFTPGIAAKGRQVYYTLSTGSETEQGDAVLKRATPDGRSSVVADLLAYELEHNPDRQPQGVDDADSNPYAVLALPGRVLVADAAGNDIVEIRSNGRMRTLTVFPVSKAGECATATNNGVANGGCDPVPTDMALGPDGFLYVSGLGAEVEGFVWKVNATTGRIVETHGGLPPLTGITIAPDGTGYASSLFAGVVIRHNTDDTFSVADVPGPAGLDFGNGVLYAGSVDFAGGPGSLLAISDAAFRPLT